MPMPGIDGYRAALQDNLARQHNDAQQATAGIGIMQAIQKQQQDQQLRDALQRGDTAALLKLPGGVDILGKLATQQNAGITGQLHAAQLQEINRKGAVAGQEQAAKGVLANLVAGGGYQANNPTEMPPTQVMQDPAAAERAAIEQYRKDPNTPFAIDVPNPANVRGLAIAAGNALPRSASAALLNPGMSGNGQRIAPRVVQHGDSPTGWGYLQGDGTITPGAPVPSTAVMKAAPAAKGNDTTGELTQDAIDNKARMAFYDQNWKVGYGRDTKTIKTVENRMAEMMKQDNISPADIISGRAGVKADSASLVKQTSQYDAVTAFEKNAVRNGEVLVKLVDKVDSTGVPVIERWIRAGKKSIAGDTDVAAFNAQIQIYRTEAARILTNPNLTGVLSDSARHEVEEFLGGNDSAPQVKRVVELLTGDFERRRTTLEQQIQTTRGRISSRMSPGQTPVPASAVTAPAAPQAPATSGWSIRPVQ